MKTAAPRMRTTRGNLGRECRIVTSYGKKKKLYDKVKYRQAHAQTSQNENEYACYFHLQTKPLAHPQPALLHNLVFTYNFRFFFTFKRLNDN